MDADAALFAASNGADSFTVMHFALSAELEAPSAAVKDGSFHLSYTENREVSGAGVCIRHYNRGHCGPGLEPRECSPSFTTSDESSFHPRVVWPLAARMQYMGELCWLVKEFSWMLLVPYVSIPFGVLTVILLGGSAWLRRRDPMAEIVPDLAAFVWLLANVVWMLAEECFSVPHHQTPWAMTPLVGVEPDNFAAVQTVVKAGFLCVPLIWACGMMVALFRLVRSASGLSDVVQLLLSLHVVTWSLKDFWWAESKLVPSLVLDGGTIFILLLAASVKSGLGLRGVDCVDLAWIVWTFSNLAWIICELALEDSLVWRYISATISFAAFLLLARSVEVVKNRERSVLRDDRERLIMV
jgi:hypothetical protein